MESVHSITAEFERSISNYTGSPYCVCVDNQSNAISMALLYIGIKDQVITIPSHTYPSIPCEIILAGGKVKFEDSPKILKGSYQLKPTKVWDSALRFTGDMYMPDTFMCLSFTGQWKHLKIGKGGAILTDSFPAYLWFKRFRYSGRRECSYHDDNLDMLGKNYYLPHILAAIGLQQILGFYNQDGTKKIMEDLALPYPDLSRFDIYKT
jgi:dTDP-4-amino-4,6-dideoxygalactose transaminase